MTHRSITWAVFATLGVSALVWQPASAYTVLPQGSVVAGKSTADWTADWWIWALQSPAASSPFADPNGMFAGVNNGGPVFFIEGNGSTDTPITRSFKVPLGKPVLVPVLNFSDTEAVAFDGPLPTADREQAAESVVAGWMASVDKNALFATIDGQSVAGLADHLETTGLFSLGPSRSGSLLELFGVPAGDDPYPSAAAGYWIVMDGLSPGPHTLHYGGISVQFMPDQNCCTPGPIGPFSADITANITVTPEPSALLGLLAGLATAIVAWTRRRTVIGR